MSNTDEGRSKKRAHDAVSATAFTYATDSLKRWHDIVSRADMHYRNCAKFTGRLSRMTGFGFYRTKSAPLSQPVKFLYGKNTTTFLWLYFTRSKYGTTSTHSKPFYHVLAPI
jgi:hypothetical protein